MRNNWLWSLLAVLLIPIIQSCETEIEINTTNQDVPIVYCILNTADSIQYVRLQKTYLVDQAAMETPPESDSMYFPGEVVITMERWSGEKVMETVRFTPTNEIPKDSGFFPSDKNLLYRAKLKIQPLQKYRLYIYLGIKEKVLYAETLTIGKLSVIDPIPLPQRKISLNIGSNYISRWEPVENAGIYQVGVRLHYNETTNGHTVEKFLDWPQGYTNPSTNVEYLSREISGARFMHILDDGLETLPGVVREVKSLDFIIMSGGLELKYYIESTAPSEGALMEKPVYSNVNNGIGVFSSVARVDVTPLFLSSVSIDSIAYGQYTSDLGFLDHTGDRDSTNRLTNDE